MSLLRFSIVRYLLVLAFVYFCKRTVDRLYVSESSHGIVKSSDVHKRASPIHADTNSWSERPVIYDKYTIVMATYKRLDLLPRVIEAYASGHLPSLHSIIIVWQDTTEAPPKWLTARNQDWNIPVHVRVSERNSMNERFRIDSRVQTQAIFMVDDDLIIQRPDLEWGFSVWQKFGQNQRIVGFSGRDFTRNIENDGYTFVVMPQKEYSMVLSNAAFFDRSFFELYWQSNVLPMRDHVDEVFNCDDLLINFLVSNKTGQAPLLLQGGKPVLSYPHTGLWIRPDHWPTRSACLGNFTQMIGQMPLVKNDFSISRDVVDHSRSVSDASSIETVQDDEWRQQSVKATNGHQHSSDFDLDLGVGFDDEDEDEESLQGEHAEHIS